jgi:GNAT superfamily N-acetyltransferase
VTTASFPDGSLQIVKELGDVRFLVRDLFSSVFGGEPPPDPVHYLAIRRIAASRFEVAGYYHVTYREDFALVGGLCVAPEYRRRGIAEQLERIAFEEPRDAKAFFAYAGDPIRARRVGFVDTRYPNLLVCWMKAIPVDEQDRMVERVAALGPF